MKILAIRGKNLASLAGEFEVDFEQEPLKSAGLFAISGPTGAGKSTLLDALCMALFEKTPRLFKAGGVGVPDVGNSSVTQQDARNLLRRGSAEGYAEVDFVGNDGIGYRARWSVGRAYNKTEGKLKKTSMSLKQLPELQPIGGTNREVLAEIVLRIGLSFEQFTRAVLLAQNEFSAFLKADDNERGELLETLTGSSIYSTLSQRAYARAKLEEQELRRINDRLADQKPLSDDTRSQLEQDSATATTAVTVLDLRKAALDTQLRWHQDEAKFQQHEQLAQAQLQQRQAEQSAAANRRTELQRLEAVQVARPLVAETERLARAIATDHSAIADCQSKLTLAEQSCQQADAALAAAQHTLTQAEQVQTSAAPQLDQAKALDARINALLPAHRLAQQAQLDADIGGALAQQKRQAKQTELSAAQHKQQTTEHWLAQHAALQSLAESWPRWDILLKQSCYYRNETNNLECILSTLLKSEVNQTAQLTNNTDALAIAANALMQADRLRQHAAQQHAAIDISALHNRKQHAESHREQLGSAEQIWRALTEQHTRQQTLDAQALTHQQAATIAEAALAQANAQIAPLAAALTQAERSLKTAEAACAASVETLRNALETDAPCPVCGATEHPYTIDNPQLHAILTSLQAEVARCRQQQQHAQGQQATHSANATSHRRQLDAIAQELQQLHAALQRQQQDWQAHSLAAELAELAKLAALDTTAQADWFASQRSAVQAEQQAIRQIEDQWRSAAKARDDAQAAFERAALEHNAKKEAASAARTALTETQSQQHANTGQLSQSRQRLADSLSQLDAAFSTEDADDWRGNWQDNPDAFHQQCASNAQQWQSQHKTRETGLQRCATLALELAALTDTHTKTELEQQRAASAHARSDADLKAMQAQRRALFSGQPVQQIEAQLADAIAKTKTLLTQHAQTSSDSQQAQTRHSEALQQARTRLTGHGSEAQAASERLSNWIAAFNATAQHYSDHSEVDAEHDAEHHAAARLDTAQLHALLTHPTDWIAFERAALHAIDNAARQAATVLQERSHQRHVHQQQRPPHDAQPAADSSEHAAKADAASAAEAASISPIAALEQALHALAAERHAKHADATALQLSLAQDSARRVQAADLLATIATQEATHRLWAQLNDLIGAADGKKFRNYAQQYTLDVLLGYANRHLNELSRRYRLQRISDTLALMVVDQDMGDELRSVHSLSGGESFLVSLALALGLASLSSNRVRVESLFIDEGFGSLDADTLRVAMDALDGLQAMGRKVGVISHVQEMTERIATRILVQRTAGGRSSVGVG